MIAQSLTYERCPRGRQIFEYGSMGDKFYMIIDGEVSVRVPNPQCRDFKRRHEIMVEERNWQEQAA
jgi:CRP-like cAMP-binding protein